jgi:hypothetical protein
MLQENVDEHQKDQPNFKVGDHSMTKHEKQFNFQRNWTTKNLVHSLS